MWHKLLLYYGHESFLSTWSSRSERRRIHKNYNSRFYTPIDAHVFIVTWLRWLERLKGSDNWPREDIPWTSLNKRWILYIFSSHFPVVQKTFISSFDTVTSQFSHRRYRQFYCLIWTTQVVWELILTMKTFLDKLATMHILLTIFLKSCVCNHLPMKI